MIKSAGIILFREKEKRQYIILQYNPNYWGLCKGEIESGESSQQAALREAEEETGLKDIEIISKFLEKTNYYFTRDNQQIYKEVDWFLGKVNDGHDGRVSDEHQSLKWISFEEAIKIITYKKDKEVVMKAEKFLFNR